jgi:hypothetical protein
VTAVMESAHNIRRIFCRWNISAPFVSDESANSPRSRYNAAVDGGVYIMVSALSCRATLDRLVLKGSISY